MTNLAWIDIETTGLDPENDEILEIGIVITTANRAFTILDQRTWVIPFDAHRIGDWIPQVVRDMHTKSGLWELCHDDYVRSNLTSYRHKFPTRTERESQMMELLKMWSAEKSPMCGSTPHFDRAFLQGRYPMLEKLFHYRNFDVSTLNQYALLWDENWKSVKNDVHRAIPDLQDSIQTARNFSRAFPWVLENHKVDSSRGNDVT
jgi:oligoribonuclease